MHLVLTLLVLAQAPAPHQTTINGAALTPARRATVAALERQSGQQLPTGAWWYDRHTGAFGAWGGPTLLWLPPGLDLGPACPLEASGALTAVIVNGRALHPIEVAQLGRWLGTPIVPGRYRLDARGDAFTEAGQPLGNLYRMARANGAGRQSFGYASGLGTKDSVNLVGDGQFLGVCTGRGNCAYVGP